MTTEPQESSPEDVTPGTVAREAGALTDHNAVAVFANMDQARGAVDALERAGIDAVHISLLGPAAEEAEAHLDTRERDAGTMDRIGKRAAVGGLAGGAAGGAVGFLAGLAAFAIPGIGPLVGAGVWATTIGGAVAGGALGGVVGGYSGADMTEAYQLTFDSVRAGHVLVGVHADDSDLVGRGAAVLGSASPAAVHRFDRSGRLVGGRETGAA
jgi:hypothetical protein